MSRIQDFNETVEFDRLLTYATDLATAQYPEARTRIERGAALVRADAVTDYRSVRDDFTVRSASDPEQTYRVSFQSLPGQTPAPAPHPSIAHTTCTCKDFQHTQALCKHGWAVLLVRKLRTLVNRPRLRTAEHGVYGRGYGMVRAAGQVEFWLGGRTHSMLCAAEEVDLGPVVEPPEWR